MGVPEQVTLVGLSSADAGTLSVEWMAEGDAPIDDDLSYEVHAANESGFEPSASTERFSGQDVDHAIVDDLEPGQRYYVRVVARNGEGLESRSTEMSTRVSETEAVRAEDTDVRVQQDDQEPTVSPDRVVFDDDGEPPEEGDIIVSASGDGYLRRVTQVTPEEDRINAETEDAALNEIFDELDISTSVRLLPVNDSQESSYGPQAMGYAVPNERRWSETGLTLSASTSNDQLEVMSSPVESASVEVDDGQQVYRGHYADLTGPASWLVDPQANTEDQSIDVTLELLSQEGGNQSSDEQLKVCELGIDEVSHPDSNLDDLARSADFPAVAGGWGEAGSDGKRARGITLNWSPSERMADSRGRPYIVSVVAEVNEKDNGCDSRLIRRWKSPETLELEIPVYVALGDLPETGETQTVSVGENLEITNAVALDFSPSLSVGARISRGSLQEATLLAGGDLSFDQNVTLSANDSSEVSEQVPIIDERRFIRVIQAGAVPIVIVGRFNLGVQIDGEVEGEIDLAEKLSLAFPDSQFGLEYNGNGDGWETVTDFQPEFTFDIEGRAEASKQLTLRLQPDLEVSFYDAASGRMLVEPYVYGRSVLEGTFSSSIETDSAASDADYRFTELEVGGGLDLRLFAGLSVFDIDIVTYPLDANSNDINSVDPIHIIEETPFAALPDLQAGWERIEDESEGRGQVEIIVEHENLSSPFNDLFGIGPESLWPLEGLRDISVSSDTSNGFSYERKEPTAEGHARFLVQYEDAGEYEVTIAANVQGLPRFVRHEERITLDLPSPGSTDSGDDPSDENGSSQEFEVDISINGSTATIDWDESDGYIYDFFLSSNPDCDISNYSLCDDSEMLSEPSSPRTVDGSERDVATYLFAEVTNSAGESDTFELGLIDFETDGGPTDGELGTLSALNDTGIDWCADGATNYKEGDSVLKRQNCDMVTVDYPGQDGMHGRDAQARDSGLEKVGAGAVGFDYTKLDADGSDLPGSATEWTCVRDNHMGLTWEVKTDDDGLRDQDHTYTWYQPDGPNMGDPGVQDGGNCSGSACDTHSFVQAVNAERLCGADDWRLPTVDELHSLSHLGQTGPAIDTDFFPNTKSSAFWSASPDAGPWDYARRVRFGDGSDTWGFKSSNYRVRLVRGGQ